MAVLEAASFVPATAPPTPAAPLFAAPALPPDPPALPPNPPALPPDVPALAPDPPTLPPDVPALPPLVFVADTPPLALAWSPPAFGMPP